MNNYERVKNMTIEQMANLLSATWHKADYEDDDYDPSFLEWLKSEL